METLQNISIIGLAICVILQARTMKRMMHLIDGFRHRGLSLNSETILCECCGKFPVFRDRKCDLCFFMETGGTIEVPTIEDAIDFLHLQEKWSNSSEYER